jgi:hypothetical protein
LGGNQQRGSRCHLAAGALMSKRSEFITLLGVCLRSVGRNSFGEFGDRACQNLPASLLAVFVADDDAKLTVFDK